MRKYILISLLSSSFLIFCNSCTEKEMEMKSFTYIKAFQLTSDSIHNALKVSIEVELPVKFQNKEILTNIQKQIIGKIFSEKYTNLPLDTLAPTYATKLYDDYRADYGAVLEKLSNKSTEAENEIQIEGIALYKDKKILSYSYERYAYMGGETGNSNRYFYNFDLSNGHIITEKDLFIDNYQSSLTELIKQRIVEDNIEIESVADLHEFDFWEDKIKPNGNFYIAEDGLVYVYNSFEIAPYSTGQTEVTLPYNRLKVLMKPDNLISHIYNKKQ